MVSCTFMFRATVPLVTKIGWWNTDRFCIFRFCWRRYVCSLEWVLFIVHVGVGNVAQWHKRFLDRLRWRPPKRIVGSTSFVVGAWKMKWDVDIRVCTWCDMLVSVTWVPSAAEWLLAHNRTSRFIVHIEIARCHFQCFDGLSKERSAM